MFVRQFKLYNSFGDEVDLMSRDHFFNSPQGLGFSKANTFRQIGDRFVLVSSKLSQGQVSGNIILASRKTIYEDYKNLVMFLSHQPLRLMYSPVEGITYYRKVVVASLEKSEIGKEGYLSCPITFNCLTPWYKALHYSSAGGDEDANLAWIWEVTFDTGFSSGIPMQLDFYSDSELECPARISIGGRIVNPRWEHRVNGELIGEGQVNTTVPAGTFLIIDATEKFDIGVYTSTGELVRSAYELADFTKDRFIMLKNGRNSIHFYGDNGETVSIKMEGEMYYESV